MQAGYLIIKADTRNNGVLLLSKSNDMPDTKAPADDKIVWVGQFSDIDTAQMHAHGFYCRQLRDLDRGSYNISKGRAIAAIESDKILEKTVFTDPDLTAEDIADKSNWEHYYKRRKQRFNAVILAIKVASVGFLVFIFVMGF